MNDYENMSPADREASIHRAYDTAQRNINTLVSRLAEEYRILEDLRDLIAERSDFACPWGVHDEKISLFLFTML